MNDSARSPRRLPSARALFIVLAITTGWMQAAAPTSKPLTFTGGRVTDDLSLPAPRAEAFSTGHHLRQSPPQGPFAMLPTASSTPLVPEPAARSFSGRNHFWIPALGISRQVSLFPCSRSRAPDNLMYRWGCAGTNNVYILGHAYGVMKALHDAYYSGRLRVGMVAIYADGQGRIRTYRVTEWRVVDPVDSGWAISSQSVPSMTLQTCVGPRGLDRLNVRLVAVD
jgi:Sortase family.